ncbi:hypothetical protein SB00610_03980 [Klebsiella quasipneumoniae subsp. similipneumoniae]|nr:hypothetical protein SB00610_03980 [Klebsiella quasipneumoniae subsp. similipneumoniae]
MADIQHVAGIVDGFRRFGLGGHLRFANAPLGAVADVQRHFVKNGVHGGGRGAHLWQRAQFTHQQRVAAGEMDQKQIILDQIATKCAFSKGAFGELPDERVRHIVLPVSGGQLA